MNFFDPQAITSGGYAMESAAGFLASLFVMHRVNRAFARARNAGALWAILTNRTAFFSMAFGCYLLMGFWNRVKWWRIHTFTDRAFFNTDYYIALNSLIITILLFFIINNLNGTSDKSFGIPNAYILLGASVAAFFASTTYYALHW